MKRSSVWLLVFAGFAALLFAFIGSSELSGEGEGLGLPGASSVLDAGPAGVLPGARAASGADGAPGTTSEQLPGTAGPAPGAVRSASASARKQAERPLMLRVTSILTPGALEKGDLANWMSETRRPGTVPSDTPAIGGVIDPALQPGPIGAVAFEIRRRGAAPSGLPLFAGSTDASGELLVPLDWPGFRLPAVGDRPDFMGRVFADGYQKHLVRAEVRESEEGELRLNLLLVPGATFSGRVTNAGGRGVEAKVTLFKSITESSSGKASVLATASQLGGGNFELHLGRNTVGDLFASAPDVGSASLLGVHLDLATPQQDLNLALTGSGLFRGRLLDTDGVPVPGHFVQAKLNELEEGALNSSQLFAFEAQLMLQGGGFCKSRTATDDDGWFLMQGLRNAKYVLRTSLKAVDYRYPLLLTDEPQMANGALLVVTLPGAAPAEPAPAPKESKDVRTVLVSVHITGVPNEADREALATINARARSSRNRNTRELPAGTVFLRHTDAQKRDLKMRLASGDALAGHSNPRASGVQLSVLGETRVFEITGTGKHELTARMPGGRTVSVPVDLDGPSAISLNLQF